jgi:hypothetical protein
MVETMWKSNVIAIQLYLKSVQDTHITALRYKTQTAYRFGHQKAVLTNLLLKMGIIMLETC